MEQIRISLATQYRIASGSGTIESISFSEQRGFAGFGVTGIKVDGKVLVDAGSIGTNGFYLPFDPEASGVDFTVTRSNTGGSFKTVCLNCLMEISPDKRQH